MNPQIYFCPNCYKQFFIHSQSNVWNKSVQLDKTYQFQIINIFCNNCKKSINGITLQKTVLWAQDYQFYYNKFVKNKNINIITNKRFLYFYFPYNDQKTVKQLFKFVKKDNFDALIIPAYFQNYFQWNKQICIVPSQIFQCNQHNLFPNYLAQKMIINESYKYENSKLFSIYNTFFYKFNILYYLKDWEKLKLKIK